MTGLQVHLASTDDHLLSLVVDPRSVPLHSAVDQPGQLPPHDERRLHPHHRREAHLCGIQRPPHHFLHNQKVRDLILRSGQ